MFLLQAVQYHLAFYINYIEIAQTDLALMTTHLHKPISSPVCQDIP